MSISAAARRTAFWSLDRARGGPIRRHLQDIRSIMEGTREPSDRLTPLLEHAIRTTPFYATAERPQLDAFPVVARPILKQEPEALYSNASASAPVREVTTSGSSGRPIAVRQDKGKRLRSIADTIYANETCGQLVGDPLLWLRAWAPSQRRTGLARRAQNVTGFEVRGLDDARIERIVGALRGRRFNAMLAYPSVLQAIVRSIDSNGIDARALGLRVIISDSESLPKRLKGELERTFGCGVADRYANEENGILALAAPGSDAFQLNRASYIFEFLELGSDRPQRAGRPARVVITDLFNYAMPLIRYDTGDLAVTPAESGSDPMSIERLEGRRLDLVFDTAGRIVSSTMLATAMDPFALLRQYQLRQLDARTYRLLVAGAEGAYTPAELQRAVVGLLGDGTQVSVEHVADIPAEANGKYRVMVPLGHAEAMDGEPASPAELASDGTTEG